MIILDDDDTGTGPASSALHAARDRDTLRPDLKERPVQCGTVTAQRLDQARGGVWDKTHAAAGGSGAHAGLAALFV